MQFNDYKISTWLGLAFGAMVLITAASGGLAISKLSAIESDLEQIVKVNNAKIKLNSDMSESVHIVARVVRTMALLDDASAKAIEAVKITKARDDYNRSWDALQKFPPSDAGRAARAKIEEAAQKARPINTKMMELALAGNTADATTLLMKEAAPATQSWQDALDSNIVLQESLNLKDFETSQSDYLTARNMIIAIIAASILLAVAMGWLITRNLVRALHEDYLARPLDYWSAEYFNAQRTAWGSQSCCFQELTSPVNTLLTGDF